MLILATLKSSFKRECAVVGLGFAETYFRVSGVDLLLRRKFGFVSAAAAGVAAAGSRKVEKDQKGSELVGRDTKK